MDRAIPSVGKIIRYYVQDTKRSKQNPVIVHVDHLKPYMGRNLPENWRLHMTNKDENMTNTNVLDETQFTPGEHSTPVTVRTRT